MLFTSRANMWKAILVMIASIFALVVLNSYIDAIGHYSFVSGFILGLVNWNLALWKGWIRL